MCNQKRAKNIITAKATGMQNTEGQESIMKG